MKRWILPLLFFSSLALGEANPESKLKESIRLSNAGQYEEAITILRRLSQQNPGDDRIFFSLGLTFRNLGRIEDAISAFEQAAALKPSPPAYHSLALLYEAMSIRNANNETWIRKAIAAWVNLLNREPADSHLAKSARRHLDHLRQDLAP